MLIHGDSMALSDHINRMNAIFDTDPGKWFARLEIAEKLNKKRLNPSEIAALEYMVEKGDLESQRVRIGGAIGYLHIYHRVQR